MTILKAWAALKRAHIKALAYDGIPANTAFAVLSARNPYRGLITRQQNEYWRLLAAARKATVTPCDPPSQTT